MSETCEAVRDAFETFENCENTLAGCRVQTHCLYPSFENVHVYVVKFGESYRISDDGGAYRIAWAQGRDETIIKRALTKEATRFQLMTCDNALVASDVPKDWLYSAILTVANASSFAANEAVSRIAASAEEDLVDKIDKMLSVTFLPQRIARDSSIRGKSGGDRHFNFAVRSSDVYDIFFNAISPHHSSINAKFVSFSDIEGEIEKKLAVYDRKLGTEDVSLLQQVATIVPIDSLITGTNRAIEYTNANYIATSQPVH